MRSPPPRAERSSTSCTTATVRRSSSSARGCHQARPALTRQAVSQHLDVLEAAGLVSTRRDGRYKFHHLDTAPLDEIAASAGEEDA